MSHDHQTNGAPGDPLSTKSILLDTGASLTQDFTPIKQICGHLNAFHVYVSDPSRSVETHHYCSHLNEDVRQWLLYDSDLPTARLIGIEYMVSAKLYADLPEDERKLWHSHVFEVKSGMLIMPKPTGVPEAIWEKAETAEMEDVITLYGKVYHLWQVDRGDKLPMGQPQLMTSFTDSSQLDFEKQVGERDERAGTDWRHKKEIRKGIAEPEIHSDADSAWRETTEATDH